MLNKNDLLALAKVVAKANTSAPTAYSWNGENYTYEQLNETLRNEFNEYAGTYALYRENKNLIFEIIEQVLTDVLPKKVIEQYNQFAEVQTFGQGERPIFRRKLKKQGVRMTKKQARRLIRGIRKYRRHHKEWCLVEVIRENGDTFGIKL